MDDFDALVLVEAVPSMNLELFAAAVTTDERVAQRPALAAMLLALRGMPSPVPVTGRSRTPMDHLLGAIGAARRCTVADAVAVARVCNAVAGDTYSPADLLTIARAKTLLMMIPEHRGTGAGWPIRAVAAGSPADQTPGAEAAATMVAAATARATAQSAIIDAVAGADADPVAARRQVVAIRAGLDARLAELSAG